MGHLRIVTLRNTDDAFYPLMGPFLSRREIVRELGDPVWDDDGKVWFIALINQRVAGFAAVRPSGEKLIFCSAYVLPDYRKQGIYTRLIKERLDYATPVSSIVTMARKSAVPALKKAGFVPAKETLNYTRMERPAR